MTNIAIFASGSGSNAEQIIEYFADNDNVNIPLIVCNNLKAGILERAHRLGVPVLMIDKKQLQESSHIEEELTKFKIDWIVLAGFLLLIPSRLIRKFPNRIINIHPALLPKYGGKGMYGSKVHETVKANGDTKTGITIHYVNEKYDEGEVILQKECPVLASDSIEDIAQKVHQLEYTHYSKTIETLLN